MKSIRMVAPPPENTSGVGKYTDTLTDELSGELSVTVQYFPAESTRPLKFLKSAIEAGTAEEDIVHIQYDYVLFGRFSLMSLLFFPVLFLTKHLFGTSVVVTMHEVINANLVGKRLWWVKAVYVSVVNKSIAKATDRTVFLSDRTERLFAQYLDEDSSCRVPHGVPSPENCSTSKETAKREFGYEADEKLIIEPGYVDPRKGSHVFREIAELMPEFEFLLAGGSPREKYDDYAEDIMVDAPSNLQLTGVLDEDKFHMAFQAADLALLPYQELYLSGVKNTVAQSGIFNLCVAHKLPVITSSCPYFKDLETKCGCVRTFEDTNGAVDVVNEFFDKEAIRMELKDNMERFHERNNYERVIAEHVTVYAEVTEDRKYSEHQK